MVKGLSKGLSFHAGLLALAVGSVAAQEPGKQPGRGVSLGTVAARRLAAANQVHGAAAAAQLASIRLSLGSMLIDAVAVSAQDPELATHRQGEILLAVAQQLELFIRQFKDTDQAEAARALLARIYVSIDRPTDAARVLKDFDAERADESDLLQAALAVAPIAEIAAKADDWLKIVAKGGKTVDQRVDAVFVAWQLGKAELAEQLLRTIATDATAFDAKAALLLAEAELVDCIAGKKAAPMPAAARERFPVNPLVDAQLAASDIAVGSWRKLDPQDATMAKAEVVARSAPPPLPGKPITKSAMLRESRLFGLIVVDAAIGLRSLLLRSEVDSTKIVLDDRCVPAADATPPAVTPSVDVVVAALLHEVVHYFPGTDAARIAARRQQADALQAKMVPVPFTADTLAGKRVSLADYRGRVVLLDFFAVASAASVDEHIKIKQIWQDDNSRGLDIVSVSLDVDEDRWVVLAAVDALGMTWPVAFDGKGVHSELARSYGVDALPARILIGRDGRVFEDRAAKLSIDALASTVDAALQQPTPTFAVSDAVQMQTDRYAGPRIDTRLSVDAAGKYRVDADVWVTGGTLAVAHVDTAADSVKVFLKLTVPMNAMAQPLVLRRATVPIDDPDLKTICVYVDHSIADAPCKKAVEPLLTSVLRADGLSLSYDGPKVEGRLLGSDSQPPEYSLALAVTVPSDAYKFRVADIVRGAKVTQVKLVIDGPKKGLADGAVRMQQLVPLGTDAASVVEVLVDDHAGRPADDPPKYALALRLPRS